MDGHTGADEDSTSPGFLLSTERSGSNLTRSIINAHPEVTAPHPLETAYPRRSIDPSSLSREGRWYLARDTLINKQYSFQPLVHSLDVDDVAERLECSTEKGFFDVQRALYGAYADEVGKSRWVSKDPDIWEYIDELIEFYDHPKFVYLVRDARDVVLSFKTSHVGRYHPYYNAKRWRDEQRIGLELLENHEDSVFLLRYEDLLRDPEPVVSDLCDHLGVEFEEAMLYYYETEDARAASDSSEVFDNLASPIQSDNFDKYREQLPSVEIKLVEKIAGDELEALGYDRMYDDDELADFELDEESYAERDQTLHQVGTLEAWRDNPEEQIRRFLSTSFSHYMALRYGVLG